MKLIVGLGKTGLSCARFLKKQSIAFILFDTRFEFKAKDEILKEFEGVKIFFGEFDNLLISKIDEIILSPGLSIKDVQLDIFHKYKIKFSNDIAIFRRYCKAKIVGITGSNGKSTVATLLFEMAKHSGIKVSVGGNLGIPALDLLENNSELYILELSSFQLELCGRLELDSSVVLNISPDHMNRYDSIGDYYNTKFNIYNHCKIAVVNRFINNKFYLNKNISKRIYFSDQVQLNKSEFGFDEKFIYLGKKKILSRNKLKINADFFVSNIVAALALGSSIGLDISNMIDTIIEFSGLKHRLEFIGRYNDISWYNDSKATNVGSAVAAINGIKGRIVLIAGGDSKGADLSGLKNSIKKYVVSMILFGKDREMMNKLFKDSCNSINIVDSLEEAVIMAHNSSIKFDAESVLLSPACSSLDMFENFEDRGNRFIEYVKKEFEQ